MRFPVLSGSDSMFLGRNIQSISNTALDAAESPRFYGEQQQNVRGARTGNVRESSQEEKLRGIANK